MAFWNRNNFNFFEKFLYQFAQSNQLTINKDGLPIVTSGNNQLWPILFTIDGLNLSPMVIGIYSEKEKPGGVKDYSSTREYLAEFVDEINSLIENGFCYENDLPVTVLLKKFCDDTVAKSLIKETKGHTAYISCGNCDVEGEPSGKGGNVCFPCYGNPRTNASFRCQQQREHHNMGLQS